MRTPQAHEAKARITHFLAKVRAGKHATVIRRNRARNPMASRRQSSGNIPFQAMA